MKRTLLFTIFLWLSNAWATIGYDITTILEPLSDYNIEEIENGYQSEDGTLFAFEVRKDKVYRVYGDGVLDEEGINFISSLLAEASGYGEELEERLIEFFDDSIEGLSGEGTVPLDLQQYLLELEVKGEEAPYDVAFALRLNEIPNELFPPAKHSIGPEDAKYVIREFSDLQCPYCGQFAAQAVPLIKEELIPRGDVRFEFHHFPLISIHSNAMFSAEASECVTSANEAETFWIYHDALFERQRAWSNLDEPNAYFVRLAKDLDLNIEGVEMCLENRDYAEELLEAYRTAGEELGLRGTPSIFINGYKLTDDYTDVDSYLTIFELVDAFEPEIE